MDNGAQSYQRFLEGDDFGMVEIIRDYKDGLILYLRGFTEDILQAEDLAEDTFVKLVTKRPRFKGKSTFKTWLYAIGRNVALDQVRRIVRHPEIDYEQCRELAGEEASLESAYIREERRILLRRRIQKLKPEYRQVLWLIYFESFSIRETASVMKRSERSVKTLVYRARLALKTQLEKEDFICEEL